MMKEKPGPGLRIGVDIGGTFTDFVVFNRVENSIETFKLLSTPDKPADAVVDGLRRIFHSSGTYADRSGQILHGSTVATNALLEHKGARTALITTKGFRDLLRIGRQNRPELYDFSAEPPMPLIPADLCFEVNERVDHQGQVLQALDLDEIEALISLLGENAVDSVAVGTLFSFLRPEHEREIASRLREFGYPVSASSEILPEYREYERMSTTAVNAYVSPVLDGYLSSLESEIGGLGSELRLRVMQSNGGIIGPGEARRYGVRCILSGPAGGVVGSRYIAAHGTEQGDDNHRLRLITFDMGGTSTDVSLVDDVPRITTEAQVGGCPIRIPILDIHTIGAGGGSIARVDAGGALRVGPQSAGANPGPACYGHGDLPTVTDANLVLGRLAGDYFLGGEMLLDRQRALHALERLGAQLGYRAEKAALGIVSVVNAHMERALRVISVERGYDPRHFTLLSFGGAGGLHSADLARGLGIPRVLVPPMASTLSAFGMLAADVVKDYTQTIMIPGEAPWQEIEQMLAPMVEQGISEVMDEGIPESDLQVERALDMRYLGQSYELVIPFSKNYVSAFQAHHRRTYGYALQAAGVEVVNLRVRVIGRVQSPVLLPARRCSADAGGACVGERKVLFAEGECEVPFYEAERLQPGNRIEGPAVVIRSDTTVLVPALNHAEVDGFLNLIITVGGLAADRRAQ